MRPSRLEVAKIGETFAAAHLKNKGYHILAQNYRASRGEIDLVAKDRDFIVFVEVKTRRSLKFGLPQEAVTPRKQQQISKIALAYLQERNLLETPCRFDVIAIRLSYHLKLLRLEHIKNAFEFQEEK
ncbi:YraN family protein [Candidatus Poribacteria bacterium]|nr:MAG: YraN family protein [Candidatus Poribacteria bacterium]